MSFSLLPDLIFPALTDVTPQALMARGIELLLLDFDNTIVPYTTDVPTERMEKWLREMQKSGVRLCVVSNSKKPRVQVFCKAYGLDCITHAKKPFQRGIRAAKEKNPEREIKILNLFGYTGAATLACMEAGATVTHVDASKGMVQWARENAAASNLAERPVRWLVDDCVKFVQREIRRGNHYDGIIMDPPSYGRGPGGEVWKLEEQLYGLVEMCVPVLTDDPLFFILNSYTTGLSPSVMAYLLGVLLRPKFGGYVSADEIGLSVTETGLVLPCGSTAIWSGEPV